MDEQVGTVYTLKGRWQERSPKPYRHSILPNQLPGYMQVLYIYIHCRCIPNPERLSRSLQKSVRVYRIGE